MLGIQVPGRAVLGEGGLRQDLLADFKTQPRVAGDAIAFNGLGGCCGKEVAPDAGCKENGPGEISGEREGRWDDKTLCNICQFMGLNPLSWILICPYAG